MAKDLISIGLGVATLAVAGYVAVVIGTERGGGGGDVDDRLAAIEAKLDSLETIEGDVRQLRASVDRRLDGVAQRVAAEVSRSAVRSAAASPGEGDEPVAIAASAMDAAGNPVALEDAIAARIEERLGARMEKLAGRERNGQGEWKAPIDELSDELEMSERQKTEVTAVFNEARDETFALLRTQRLDGTSLLDDFVEDLRTSEDPEGATRDFFGRILSDKIPGTDRTYLAELIALRGDVETALGRELEAAQMTKLRTLRVDLLDVKTGHDPIGEYVQSQLQ